jgi:hypothetical protein
MSVVDDLMTFPAATQKKLGPENRLNEVLYLSDSMCVIEIAAFLLPLPLSRPLGLVCHPCMNVNAGFWGRPGPPQNAGDTVASV